MNSFEHAIAMRGAHPGNRHSLFALIARGLGGLGQRLRRRRNRRRAVETLESLPGAVLRDIGIRRSEVPLIVDLAARARERAPGR